MEHAQVCTRETWSRLQCEKRAQLPDKLREYKVGQSTVRPRGCVLRPCLTCMGKNGLDDGEGSLVIRCLNKSKLLELARYLKEKAYNSKWSWWLRQLLWNPQDEIEPAEEQRTASRKGKSMCNYTEIHKEGSKEAVATNWIWGDVMQLLQKKNQEIGLNYLWKYLG